MHSQFWNRIIGSRIIQNLVRLLSNDDNNLKQAALEIMNNIAEGTNEQKQILIECGLLSRVHLLLGHSDEDVKLEARTFVRLITDGTSTQKQTLIDESLVPVIIDKLMTEKAEDSQWAKIALCNLTIDADEGRILYLVQCGIITPFSKILTDGDRTKSVSTK